jgi:hypothetical protein
MPTTVKQTPLEEAIEKYPGKTNYGKPKADYIRKVFAMTEVELLKECQDKIWLSAYAANNPRSDYHFMCDVCYDASFARDGKAAIYAKAHRIVSKQNGG